MRGNKKNRYLSLMLALLLFNLSFLPALNVEAGRKEILLDKKSTMESGSWSNPENDVVIQEGKILFSNKSTEDTRFITRTKVKAIAESKQLVTMSASATFRSLPGGKSFILGFGLAGVEALPKEAGNVEVTFTNNGGIKVGIVAYDANGKAVTVASPKSAGIALNSAATVRVEIDTNKAIRVMVNGSQICSGTIPGSGEGNVGFLQSGGCGVEIDNLELIHWQYDRPENVNISEDFENKLNIAVLSAAQVWVTDTLTGEQIIEEYNGSQVMMFRNISGAYVGTNYMYSNFKMSFDVPYLLSEQKTSEDGSVIYPATKSIQISIGGEQTGSDSTKSAESIVIGNGTVSSLNDPSIVAQLNDRNPFANGGKPFSVEISVIDGEVKVGMKWLGEKRFQTVLTYKLLGSVPTGYLNIWAPKEANFAIDNLKIENMDDNPNVITVEHKSSKIEIEDAKYVPMERVYASDKPGKAPVLESITNAVEGVFEQTFKPTENKEGTEKTEVAKSTGAVWYLLILATAVVCVVALSVTIVVSRKRKNQKEANGHEE